MQKDVIYIDVDDDITGIIGKVKASEHKIVALVPPKRIGILQSAVNLRLVNRAAEQSKKRLVVITNNHALSALAAAASIPVAKNLQSKPELAKKAVIDDDEDEVIDGADLPIGDHAKSVGMAEATPEATDDVAPEVSGDKGDESTDEDITDEIARSTPVIAASVTAAKESKPKKASPMAGVNSVKIPNFSDFRKKALLIVGGGVLALAFLIWALFFAASARIIVSARTTDVAVTDRVTLAPDVSTNQSTKTLKSLTKTLKKDVSLPFVATGKKDVGEKATGTVRYSNSEPEPVTIPAGAVLSVSGMSFTNDAQVTVPGAKLSFGCPGYLCPGTASGSITASASGSSYNGATGSVSGAGTSGTLTAATSGGTDKTVTVVSQLDVDKAKEQAMAELKADTIRKELASQFKDAVAVDQSFKSDAGALKPSVAVDQEVTDGKVTLTGSVNYTMAGVAKSELATYLDSSMKADIGDKQNQRVYDNGTKAANFTNVNVTEKNIQANLSTNGKVGPNINESTLKEFAKGKRYGEIQSHVEAISGVDSADVKFSPFWVNSAPNDVKRIKIEFKLNGN